MPEERSAQPARPARSARSRRRRAVVRTALLGVLLVGFLFVFVYPTRTFLDQRAETNRTRAQLELLRSENAKLATDDKKLKSDAEIERIARESFGLVRPGEKAFVILPVPTTATAAPTTTSSSPTTTTKARAATP